MSNICIYLPKIKTYMKTTLLIALGALCFASSSLSQQRHTGITSRSFSGTPLVQNTAQPALEQHLSQSDMTNTLVNRAPCIDTLLFEDFQSETIPATWINQDLDGLTDANGRPGNWHIFADMQTTTPGDTNYVAAASSWFTPTGTANNVLILGAVSPCASTVMQWSSAPFEGPTYMDGYEVRVSTTGTNIADFTTTIFTAAEDINGTGTPGAGTVHSNFNGSNGVLQDWTVNLGAYDNQTIYIAFFHNSNDDNLIMLDNIFIGVETPYDISVSSTTTEPYYITPLSQVTPRTFTANLELQPDQDVTNPTANLEIFQGATSVFTDAPTAASLSPGTALALTTAGFTPSAVDQYTAIINATVVETDPNLLNNRDTVRFEVNDSIFATENGTFNGSLGIGAGTSGFLGNMYTLPNADELTSLTFTLSAPVIGDTVVGAIYDMVAGQPNQVLALTDTLFVTSDVSAEYTLPIASGYLSLTAGSYVAGVIESTSQNVSLATNSEYYTPGMSWVFFNGTWDNNESFGFPNTYLMRANFGLVCFEPVTSFTETNNNGEVSFTNTSTSASNAAYSWDFGDGQTSTDMNPTHTYTTSGVYSVCLTVTDSCGVDVECTTVTICLEPVTSFTESINGPDVSFTNTSTSASNATYSWDFGDGQTSTDENPTHTYTSNGAFTACLTVTDSCGAIPICTTINISTVGLSEISFIDGLSIYPVPAQNSITVANLTSGENFKLELVNSLGQTVKFIDSKGLEIVQMDLSTIVDGYYHLKVSNSKVNGIRPVLVKH